MKTVKIPIFHKEKQALVVKIIKNESIRHKMSEIFEEPDELVLEEMIKRGESNVLEFKPSLFVTYDSDPANKNLSLPILKTIAAFMNSDGGTLLLGVGDDGKILGIERDYNELKGKQNWD